MSHKSDSKQPFLKFLVPKPEPEPTGGWNETPVRCTSCKTMAPLEDYDCLGLDGNDLACNQCGHIGPMEIVAWE